MPQVTTIKANHRAIQTYYEALRTYGDHAVTHETALRSAFQNLLADLGKTYHWTLIPEQSLKLQGKTVRPDGTLRDEFNLPRGYWESKDTGDNLDNEIRKKAAKGYPLTNIIFEDTLAAALYQDGKERFRADLKQPTQVADLLNQFFGYAEPDIEGFEQAVTEFKERVPELAKGLDDKIKVAHKDNRKFIAAFDTFYELCKVSLNPNISVAAVDEMLVQHLLTERLIRKIFDNPEFTRRNVIAAEVEKVIDALVSRSFNRDDFLRSLDRFYKAIEDAAHKLEDFSEKQHFLNSIYERFFQGYSVKIADTHGIVYTPQPIVDFMCASVVEVLQTEFGKSLGDPDVVILDPATGTGNFVVNLLRRAAKRDLEAMYRERLFANEIMLLPYYIAALNIEHAYYELTGQYEAFEGLCFVDTLAIAEGAQMQMSFMTEANSARVERQKKAPITVIIGNPPYNTHQQDENDNNKNRKYEIIDKRVRDTYAKDSNATNKNALSDMYVKFFRWATDRLQERDGIICYVSNNSFIDQIAFDGMRKHLSQDFTQIYLLDLKGNIRKDSMRDGIPLGEAHTVFGLGAMVGISITLLIRNRRHKEPHIFHYGVDFRNKRQEKFTLLEKAKSVNGLQWKQIVPDTKNIWLMPENADQFTTFLPLGSKETKLAAGLDGKAIFKSYGRGIATSRDDVVYDFERQTLVRRVQQVIEDYNSEVDRYKRLGGVQTLGKSRDKTDDFVQYSKIKWSFTLKSALERGTYARFEELKIRNALYRPYCKRYLFFDRVLNESVYQFPHLLPVGIEENQIIAVTDIGSEKPFMLLITNAISDLHLVGAGASCQCLSYYVYDEDGSNRRENITDWALAQFRDHYGGPEISKWDIFYYVYGVLHHPDYREKFADNLKRELPRIPFAPDFRAFAKAGQQLADLHLNYETVEPYRLRWIEAKDEPLSYRVEKMRLNKDKTQLVVNDSLTLANIPPDVFKYRLGNRSALDWVIDQYQITTDKRSGITSDPNREDEPRYIVDLVERVVQVSLETVRLVAGLPEAYSTAIDDPAPTQPDLG